jgi:hypothetical protein
MDFRILGSLEVSAGGTCYRRSLTLCRDIADRKGEATALTHIGIPSAHWRITSPPAKRGRKPSPYSMTSTIPTPTGSEPRSPGIQRGRSLVIP